jgi:hypothetical protein
MHNNFITEQINMAEFITGTKVWALSAAEGNEKEHENYVMGPGMYLEYRVCTLYNLCREHKYNNMTLPECDVINCYEHKKKNTCSTTTQSNITNYKIVNQNVSHYIMGSHSFKDSYIHIISQSLQMSDYQHGIEGSELNSTS